MLRLDRVCDNLSASIKFDPYVPVTITWGDEVSGLDYWSPRAEGHDTIVEIRTSRADGTLRQIVVSSIARLTDIQTDTMPDVDNAEHRHPVLRWEGVDGRDEQEWYERETVPNLDVSLTPPSDFFVRWSRRSPTKALENERLTLLFDEEQIFVGFLVSGLTPEDMSLLRDS